MLNGTCVKCAGAEVHRITQARWAGTGYPLTANISANVSLFVCAACGYTETWTDRTSLELIRRHGRRIVPQPGPGEPEPTVIRPESGPDTIARWQLGQ